MRLKSSQLSEQLGQSADDGTANGTVVIIDTLKKFTDLMDKKRSSEFGEVCRRYVMAGGTIIALGHTRKNPKADGTPQYQGTTDVLEDFDAVYIASLRKRKADGGDVLVEFNMEKRRGNSPAQACYTYTADADAAYEEKLASVRYVHPDETSDFESARETTPEFRIAIAIEGLIDAGFDGGQMALAEAAAAASGVSERSAQRVLKKYTGTTVGEHYWTFRTGPRGVRLYELIPKG